MNTVHPTAIVGKRVELGDANEIGPGCVIEEGVVLGSRNKLWHNVYVGPGTTLGDENQIHMGAGGPVSRPAEKLVRDAFIWSHLAGDTVQRLKVAGRLARQTAA